MRTMSYTESRARYAEVLDSVVDNREEIVITRAEHDPVVIVSLDDFESLRETAHLMRSPENAWDDYLWWQAQDRRVFRRINLLVRNIARNGNAGIGKPEALKHDLAGYWSRRVTYEHRLVYKYREDEIRVASCRYHYGR